MFIPFNPLRPARSPSPRRLLLPAFAMGLFLWCSPSPRARAELWWEQKTVEVPVTTAAVVGATPLVLQARYPFVNQGTAPVEIRSVQTSCGCTTAALSKKTYAPGEHGEILAKFEVGERVGPQEKMLTVLTNEETDEPTVLRLKTDIPELGRMRPSFVFWARGEAPEPKSITFESFAAMTPAAGSPTTSGARLTGVKVESSTPEITVECQEAVPGQRYELVVRPLQTERYVVATLRVVGSFEVPALAGAVGGATHAERTWMAYAAIKPPPVSAQ